MTESTEPSESPASASPPRDVHSAPMITPEHFRTVLGHFCSGVTIVTAIDQEGPIGLTAQSFTALSLDPPLVLFCPGRSSTSWPRIEATGTFCVNVLAEPSEELCRGFATKGGDKFAGVGWKPALGSGAPQLTDALAWIDCRLEAIHDGGDHLIAVGRVLDLGSTEGRPLLFFRGGYGRFGV